MQIYSVHTFIFHFQSKRGDDKYSPTLPSYPSCPIFYYDLSHYYEVLKIQISRLLTSNSIHYQTATGFSDSMGAPSLKATFRNGSPRTSKYPQMELKSVDLTINSVMECVTDRNGFSMVNEFWLISQSLP